MEGAGEPVPVSSQEHICCRPWQVNNTRIYICMARKSLTTCIRRSRRDGCRDGGGVGEGEETLYYANKEAVGTIILPVLLSNSSTSPRNR